MLKVNSKLLSMHPWLNWIERLATDQEVAGSSPAGCTYLYFTTCQSHEALVGRR
jgi:hypothetical protein